MQQKDSKRFRSWCLVILAVVGLAGGVNCASFGEKLNDLTQFCNAVGDVCTEETASDCSNKLGSDSSKLKETPDYKGAKNCVMQLSTCTKLPDECWAFALEK
jgi:hypothetical protein